MFELLTSHGVLWIDRQTLNLQTSLKKEPLHWSQLIKRIFQHCATIKCGEGMKRPSIYLTNTNRHKPSNRTIHKFRFQTNPIHVLFKRTLYGYCSSCSDLIATLEAPRWTAIVSQSESRWDAALLRINISLDVTFSG